MAEDVEKRKKAEEFADYMEAEFRKLGASGDFFCRQQRLRWREHSIRAYLGSSHAGEESSSLSEPASADS